MERNKRYRELLESAGHALLILPAVFLGVLAMIRGGVSPALWGQQAAAWLVLALLAWPLRRAASRIPDAVWSALCLILLAAALFGEAAGGARRWVNLAVFHVNAAMLVLPALLVVLCRAKHPCPVLLAAAVIVCLQPDLAQLAALCAAAIPILLRQGKKLLWGSCLILAVLVIRCLNTPVAIEPAAYCEGILEMLAQTSALLAAAGWVALAAVPAFWLVRFLRRREIQQLSLAAYYAVMMLFALSGDYPVPLMGFGLSPVAGYYLAYICGAAEQN